MVNPIEIEGFRTPGHTIHDVALRDCTLPQDASIRLALYECQDNPGDWNDHRFREVSDHRKDAAVPCQRRLSYFTGDLAYFGIDRIEHARQVSRDSLDEQPSEPFIEFVEYAAHKRSPPDDQPNRPESRGTRVMPMRATPPPAINCFIPN